MIHLVPVQGRVGYGAGLEWQRRLAKARISGELAEDVVLLVEHEPVVTLGRGASAAHLLASPERLERVGIERFEVERGGDVTYHGPGQLVGYPILHLGGWRKDLHWYLRRLEEALIAGLGALGLRGVRAPGYTGVWVGEEAGVAGSRPPSDATALAAAVVAGRLRKIASIGVHVSRWVTWHGFALNRTEEPLRHFRLIVPCGIPGVRMTSLSTEGAESGTETAHRALAEGFARAFGTETKIGSPVRPGEEIEGVAAGRGRSATLRETPS